MLGDAARAPRTQDPRVKQLEDTRAYKEKQKKMQREKRLIGEMIMFPEDWRN